ncbi:nucleotide exchange factor GrpE [Ligaoa zhengdingensis]|uniref:nucleotide exchange factor GrpE n=1 Tax=Ligaoa zhengdingensis TaxID=2763658 RepID=UPI0031BB8999
MSAKKANAPAPDAEEIEEIEVEQGGEPETGAAAGEAAPPEKTEAEQLAEQVEQLNDRLMRTLAEYDNYRKRSQKERTELYPEAVAATVAKFLPVVDNFERALESACSDADFKKGVEMIYTSMMECLKGLGVEEIEAQGAVFDPNFHNAVMHIEDEALGENVVASVFQKGYKIGERVLRHAMVQVAN